MKQLFASLMFLTLASCNPDPIDPPQTGDGLVAHFKLDGNTFDSSPTGAHGITNQGVSPDRFGTPNSAYNFVNGYFCSGLIPLNLKSQFTYSMWMKMNGYDYGNAVMELNQGRRCNLNPIFWQFQNVVYLSTSSNSNIRMAVPQTPSCNGWTHILFTSNNGLTKLYINGRLVETKWMPWPQTSMVELSLGNANNTCSPFRSQPSRVNIDEVRIYNRVLTNSEISSLSECTPPQSPTK